MPLELEIDLDDLVFDEDFVATLAQIMILVAGKTDLSNTDKSKLQNFLGDFQDKIREQDRATLDPVLNIASKLEDVLMVDIINSSINAINNRNTELNKLAKKLGIEIANANLDATALNKITAEIEKATKIVKEAKTAAKALGNAGLTTIEKLEAVLKALEELQGIFNP